MNLTREDLSKISFPDKVLSTRHLAPGTDNSTPPRLTMDEFATVQETLFRNLSEKELERRHREKKESMRNMPRFSIPSDRGVKGEG